MGDRQVTRGRNRHDALARIGEGVQFAEYRDVVESRIGAGVGDHDQPVLDENAAAIGHDVLVASRPHQRPSPGTRCKYTGSAQENVTNPPSGATAESAFAPAKST
jgi:hypothetical protein